MTSPFKTYVLLFTLSLLGACAHNIQLDPNSGGLPSAVEKPRSALVVGYYISDEDRSRRVITPGGGGDKVEYSPYKDLEAGLVRVISNIFTDVRVMKSMEDKVVVAGKGISVAFRPTIVTTSSSSSMLTWPPTYFLVTINIKAFDPSGKILWSESVSGTGNAEFSEFKSDFSLSARRASAGALHQLQARLLDSGITFSAIHQQALQGSNEGQHTLANMYFTGNGTQVDIKSGMSWLTKAADQGYALAQYELGERYRTGSAVPLDEPKAEEYFNKAKLQGNTEATRGLIAIQAERQRRADAVTAAVKAANDRANATAAEARERAAATAAAAVAKERAAVAERERKRKLENEAKLKSL